MPDNPRLRGVRTTLAAPATPCGWTATSPWTTPLKSLQKSLDGDPREHVYAARVVIRDAAFTSWTACAAPSPPAPRRPGPPADGRWTPNSPPCSISNSPGSGRAWLLRRPGHYLVRHRATG
jgi:hypothetical protein